MITKEGPTNLITTTTLVHLDPELETRMLSVTVADTPEQTKQVLLAQARRYEHQADPDLRTWCAFGEWLRLGPREVDVPFAVTLADMIDPAAVRLRRDFPNLLALIEAHALLHQHARERDHRGRVVATAADYTAVHRLTAAVLAEGAERSIKPIVRETVKAISTLQYGTAGPIPDHSDRPVSIRKLADHLRLDQSAARRRAYAAIDAGYVENIAAPRRAMLLKITGTQMPEERAVLPTPEALLVACNRARTTDTPSAAGTS